MTMTSRHLSTAMLCVTLANFAVASETRFVRASAPAGGNGQSWATAYRKLFDALDDAAAHPTVNQIYGGYFPEAKPARVTIAVKALPRVAAVEIEMIALA